MSVGQRGLDWVGLGLGYSASFPANRIVLLRTLDLSFAFVRADWQVENQNGCGSPKTFPKLSCSDPKPST